MRAENSGNLLKTVREALLTGGDVLKKGFHKKRRVTYKSEISPVTQVDLKSEKKIIDLIRRKFPHHSFLAEESSQFKNLKFKNPERCCTRWIIDPLDGTINYIHGVPQACVSIGVEWKGEIVAGGIFDPFRHELFLARRGGGATLNGRRIKVSKEKKLKKSLLITGFPYDRNKKARRYLHILEPFLRNSMGVRRFGAAALDMAWVACGRAEGFWEQDLNPWDVAAGLVLVQEAGGKVTDFSGQKYPIDNPAQTLASNGAVHAQMISNLSKSTRFFA